MITLTVKVKPNARQQKTTQLPDGTWVVQLIQVQLEIWSFFQAKLHFWTWKRFTSPPMDGKAKQELIDLLAKQLNVPKSQGQIKTGQTARTKLIEMTPDP